MSKNVWLILLTALMFPLTTYGLFPGARYGLLHSGVVGLAPFVLGMSLFVCRALEYARGRLKESPRGVLFFFKVTCCAACLTAVCATCAYAALSFCVGKTISWYGIVSTFVPMFLSAGAACILVHHLVEPIAPPKNHVPKWW